MGQVHREEIVGYKNPDTNDLMCLCCVRNQKDNGWPLLNEKSLLLKDDVDKDYIYFCDFCGIEMRPLADIFFEGYVDAGEEARINEIYDLEAAEAEHKKAKS